MSAIDREKLQALALELKSLIRILNHNAGFEHSSILIRCNFGWEDWPEDSFWSYQNGLDQTGLWTVHAGYVGHVMGQSHDGPVEAMEAAIAEAKKRVAEELRRRQDGLDYMRRALEGGGEAKP